MIAAILLGATLTTAPALAAATPRFVVLHLRVTVYGVSGSGTIELDRRTGRFVRRFDAGAASESEGFDGTRAWRADATGSGRIEGNAGERNEIVEWSGALVNALLSHPASATVSSGRDRTAIAFARYRIVDGLNVPGSIAATSSQNGTWKATVRTVEAPRRIALAGFEPPPLRRDFALSGVTRLALTMAGGAPQIDVRLNGVRLRFVLDTGGQNVVTASAAARAGLHASGDGIVRGGGGGTVPIRYAFAHTVAVGRAVMRDQPFIILPDGSFGADGIVGYELLARFAARLDMTHGTLELAPHASAFGPTQRPVPFEYFDRQPQVDGSLDAIHGPLTIDTGSSLTAAVEASAVRRYALVARLHAVVASYAQDVGSRYPIYLVRARELRLDSTSVDRPLLDLLTRGDASDDPAILANVGDGLLRRWILVFDYAHQTIDLRPGGDPSGNVVHDRSGIVLGTSGNTLTAATVLSATPAAEAGIRGGARIVAVNGRSVFAADLLAVRTLLRGAPGTVVRVRLEDGATRAVALRRYL